MNIQSTVSPGTGWRTGSAAHAGDKLACQAKQPCLPLQALKHDAFEARQEVPVGDIRFGALQTQRDIDAIKYLREELHLPDAAVAAPEFRALEKKETSTAWWAPSPAVTH